MEQPTQTTDGTGTVAIAMAAALAVALFGWLTGFSGRKWVLALILSYAFAIGAWMAGILRGMEEGGISWPADGDNAGTRTDV